MAELFIEDGTWDTAVGKGTGSLRGALSNTGTWSLNDGPARQLPDTMKPFLLAG